MSDTKENIERFYSFLEPDLTIDKEKELKIDILDKGYVRILPRWVMGYGDIEISNDARTSFNKENLVLQESDLKLIRYLGKHEHTSCFRGTSCKIEAYAPLMVARQWWKYIIGSDHEEPKLQDSFTNWNESSRRYITEQTEYYLPSASEWRSTPENKKQGSGACLEIEAGSEWTEKLLEKQLQSIQDYEEALAAGICAEQARLFLMAYGLYVRWRWTASLQTVAHFINQRIASDAQKEIQNYAKGVYLITKPIWKVGLDQLIKAEIPDLEISI